MVYQKLSGSPTPHLLPFPSFIFCFSVADKVAWFVPYLCISGQSFSTTCIQKRRRKMRRAERACRTASEKARIVGSVILITVACKGKQFCLLKAGEEEGRGCCVLPASVLAWRRTVHLQTLPVLTTWPLWLPSGPGSTAMTSFKTQPEGPRLQQLMTWSICMISRLMVSGKTPDITIWAAWTVFGRLMVVDRCAAAEWCSLFRWCSNFSSNLPHRLHRGHRMTVTYGIFYFCNKEVHLKGVERARWGCSINRLDPNNYYLYFGFCQIMWDIFSLVHFAFAIFIPFHGWHTEHENEHGIGYIVHDVLCTSFSFCIFLKTLCTSFAICYIYKHGYHHHCTWFYLPYFYHLPGNFCIQPGWGVVMWLTLSGREDGRALPFLYLYLVFALEALFKLFIFSQSVTWIVWELSDGVVGWIMNTLLIISGIMLIGDVCSAGLFTFLQRIYLLHEHENVELKYCWTERENREYINRIYRYHIFTLLLLNTEKRRNG